MKEQSTLPKNALSVGELSEEFLDKITVPCPGCVNWMQKWCIWWRATVVSWRAGFNPRRTSYSFEKHNFLKKLPYKNSSSSKKSQTHAGCEQGTLDVPPNDSIARLHWSDCTWHILLIYADNFMFAKLDYHFSEEPVDLFLTTPVVCTRQQ